MSEITITLTCSERQMLLIVSDAWKKASSFLIKTEAKIISDPKLKNVFSHFLFIRPFGQMFIGQRFCFLTARADFFSVYDKKIFFSSSGKKQPFDKWFVLPHFSTLLSDSANDQHKTSHGKFRKLGCVDDF